MKNLIFIVVTFLSISAYSQAYVLKWDKQKIQITLPKFSEMIAEDTINDIDYFEFYDEKAGYDFAFEMIEKGEKEFEYHKDLYKYAMKEVKKSNEKEVKDWRTGKLDGLNSFYALAKDEYTDSITGRKYSYVGGELIFYSKDKKKLFYFDIEYDEVSTKQVEIMIKSIKFYE